MILRLFVFCIIFSFCGETVFAQATNTSVLYEISGGNLKQKSYLVGTIHHRDYHIRTKFFSEKDSVLYYFNQCNTFVSLDKSYEPITKDQCRKLLEFFYLPGSLKLKDLYTKKELKRIKTFSDRLFRVAIPGTWNIQKPQTIINNCAYGMSSEYPYEYRFRSSVKEDSMLAFYRKSLDDYLMFATKKKKKEIARLVNCGDSFKTSRLNSVPLAEQTKNLISFIDSANTVYFQIQ
ncbi:MAG: hypothetical protein H7282_17350 [Cytophagaceae bacterium]|nr:hypothetical protein [Cytophagaceae bacterium]